jgi:hypothetical protein
MFAQVVEFFAIIDEVPPDESDYSVKGRIVYSKLAPSLIF